MSSACILFFVASFILSIPPSYASASWTQTDWSGGSGQLSWSNATQFSSSSGITSSVANQSTLAVASGWYNTQWNYRKKITFDNSAQAENLINFPVLIALTASNFDFSKAQSAGQDLRFIDTDGSTVLNYEIESYDSSGSTAAIWVKVPQIDASSNTDYIYIYYGNASASSGSNASGTWNANFLSVMHLKETGNGTASEFIDSTSNGLHGTGGGGSSSLTPTVTTSGKIGSAQTFDGTNDYIALAQSTFKNLAKPFSVSLWFKSASSSCSGTLLDNGNYSGSTGGWGFELRGSSLPCNVFSRIRVAPPVPPWEYGKTDNGQVPQNTWVNMEVVYDTSTLSTYVNGISLGSTSQSGNPVTNQPLAIGKHGDSSSTYFNGQIDEIRISNAVRSAAWAAAEYKTVAGTYSTFATEETYYNSTGTLTSSVFDGGRVGGSLWQTLSYTATVPTASTVSVKLRTSNSSTMSSAPDFATCSAISSGADASLNSCVVNGYRYAQYQVTLQSNATGTNTPTFSSFSLNYASYDTDPPTSFGITSPTDGIYSSNPLPTITWSASTDSKSGIGKYQAQVDGTTIADSVSALATSYTLITALADGAHVVKVIALDADGNTTASAPVTVNIDTTAPVSFDTIAPSDKSFVKTTLPTISWNSSSDGGSGLSKYQVSIDGSIVLGSIPATQTSATLTTALTEGVHTWKIIAIDSVGNSAVTKESAFTVDLTKPAGRIVLDKASDSPRSVFIAISALDPVSNAVASGVAQMRLGEQSDLSKIAWEDFSTTKNVTLSKTNAVLYAQFKDAAGNESTVVSTNTELPKLTLASFSTVNYDSKVSQWYYTGHRPTFSGTAEPGASILVTVHSDPVSCSTIADSKGKWSCAPDSDIPNGDHTVAIQTISTTGNYNDISFKLGINTGLAATGTNSLLAQLIGMVLIIGCGLLSRRVAKGR